MKRAVVWSRAALDELKAQAGFIARDNPAAARRVTERIRITGDGLSHFATGRPGRVAGTYEKSMSGLPSIVAYAIERTFDFETVIVLHVIHTARDRPAGSWPD